MSDHEWHDIARYNLVMPQNSVIKLYNIKSISHHYNNDIIKTDNENEHKKECSSCVVYIVFFSILFTISIVIGIYLACSHWYLRITMLTLTLRKKH